MATNPFQFIQQARAEIGKVSWPSRREVMLTTVMVFMLALVAAIFFFGVDFIIRFTLEQILLFFGGS
ncbi:preprotein translocase subunit SecE [Rhodobacterales bacterium HKCCE3408]|nr:preprotein translocase subunit SecE [Rhodobacterales bacterium HKCCE3408]